MDLRTAIQRMLSKPDAELDAIWLAAKRNHTLDFIHAELRDMRSVRRVAEPRVKRVLPVPVQRHESVDERNRRTVEALGRRIEAEKRRDDLRRRMYPTPEELEQDRHRARLTDIQHMARVLLDGE